MPNRALTLRLARRTDAPAMAAMTRQFIEAGLVARYSAARVARLIDDRDTIALVADDGAALQGFAIMSFEDEHTHLMLLCVRPPQRRQGTGRRLVQWLVQSADVAGIASVHLELRADNDGAQAFYRSLGFTEARLVPGYYDGRVDALRMARVLRKPVSGRQE
jgi:ribosomal protein S18 acetylase RimI-like enzyme